VSVKAGDLAEYLDRTPTFLSRALHNDWECAGVRVRRFAVWENDERRNRVSHYEIPISEAVQIIPREYHQVYDL